MNVEEDFVVEVFDGRHHRVQPNRDDDSKFIDLCLGNVSRAHGIENAHCRRVLHGAHRMLVYFSLVTVTLLTQIVGGRTMTSVFSSAKTRLCPAV